MISSMGVVEHPERSENEKWMRGRKAGFLNGRHFCRRLRLTRLFASCLRLCAMHLPDSQGSLLAARDPRGRALRQMPGR